MTSGRSRSTGIRLERVVVVQARYHNRRPQAGSGFLVAPGLVLTAEHCTRADDGELPHTLEVIRVVEPVPETFSEVSQVREVLRGRVFPDADRLDIAVLRLCDPTWGGQVLPLSYGRIDRLTSGVLNDCEVVGFPYYQLDSETRSRDVAEIHGSVRRSEGYNAQVLTLRDAELDTVSNPRGQNGPAPAGSPWRGLSGALVFRRGVAIGVVIEHRRNKGAAAIDLLPFDRLLECAGNNDVHARDVADSLGLRRLDQLQWVHPESCDDADLDGPTKAHSQRPQGASWAICAIHDWDGMDEDIQRRALSSLRQVIALSTARADSGFSDVTLTPRDSFVVVEFHASVQRQVIMGPFLAEFYKQLRAYLARSVDEETIRVRVCLCGHESGQAGLDLAASPVLRRVLDATATGVLAIIMTEDWFSSVLRQDAGILASWFEVKAQGESIPDQRTWIKVVGHARPPGLTAADRAGGSVGNERPDPGGPDLSRVLALADMVGRRMRGQADG